MNDIVKSSKHSTGIIYTHNFFQRCEASRNNAASDLSLKGRDPTLTPLPLRAVSCKFSVSNQRILIEHESISKRSRGTGFVINPVLRAWTFKRATIPSCVHLYCPSNSPSLPCSTLVLHYNPFPSHFRHVPSPSLSKIFLQVFR